ncbi:MULTISPECIES: helix-turn-helix domain-containing protein [unclassified Methylobacterium]|uniref:helix-turn-helix domain-containing protein n=1 Tax=unclassified Methylobacterium TaxID=2615210 RepID=UPI0011CBCBED|nr:MULTISPECIES: helix-turn-helix domain-containing protein [unclassified Methylobacterium]MCJ2009867.1 helix-turn-helix domain-containing protein [Methylobacterium sp. J-092]TXN64641.1 helix-turn-helix domain-containing protein [Methylobacterium sp. WL6]
MDPYAYPPRGLDLAAAARYLGLTPTAFSALVRVGELPSARQLGVTAVWGRMALDAAFEAASADEVQPNGKPPQKQRDTPMMSKEWPGHPNVYTPETLAERWRCSGTHVRNMIKRGDLAGSLLGGRLLRISAAVVAAYENADTGKARAR